MWRGWRKNHQVAFRFEIRHSQRLKTFYWLPITYLSIKLLSQAKLKILSAKNRENPSNSGEKRWLAGKISRHLGKFSRHLRKIPRQVRNFFSDVFQKTWEIRENVPKIIADFFYFARSKSPLFLPKSMLPKNIKHKSPSEKYCILETFSTFALTNKGYGKLYIPNSFDR